MEDAELEDPELEYADFEGEESRHAESEDADLDIGDVREIEDHDEKSGLDPRMSLEYGQLTDM